MESGIDRRLIDHKVTDWVMGFAAWHPNDWFSASHVAKRLDVPVEAVRATLTDMSQDWLDAWLHYECPDHDFTLVEKRVDEPVGVDEFVTCTGEGLGVGHDVHPSPEHALVVFRATATLTNAAKKEEGEPATLSSPEDEEVGVDDSDSAAHYNINIGVLKVGGYHVGDTTNQQFGPIRAGGNVTINNQINSAGATIFNDVDSGALRGLPDDAKEGIKELTNEIAASPDLSLNEQNEALELLKAAVDALKKDPGQRDKGFLKSAFKKIKGIVKRAKPVLVVAIKVAAIVLAAL